MFGWASFKQCPINWGQGIVPTTLLCFVVSMPAHHAALFILSWLKQLAFFSFFSSLALGTVGWDAPRAGSKRSLSIIGGDSGECCNPWQSFGVSRGHILSESSFFVQETWWCRFLIFHPLMMGRNSTQVHVWPESSPTEKSLAQAA